jgi:hypothetical protein
MNDKIYPIRKRVITPEMIIKFHDLFSPASKAGIAKLIDKRKPNNDIIYGMK